MHKLELMTEAYTILLTGLLARVSLKANARRNNKFNETCFIKHFVS